MLQVAWIDPSGAQIPKPLMNRPGVLQRHAFTRSCGDHHPREIVQDGCLARFLGGAASLAFARGRCDGDGLLHETFGSLLRQFARVKLTTSAGRASFQVGSVPPGRYAVTPMGARGASLSARPAAARLIVTAEVGARADFEIVGAL